ncbi:SixA phosphatase family protein [Agrobacterium sp. ES01]|uniref:SixA phosphatase family protein n=1 Tax=Agrobacterium sp. ES01 TaxID=3420714 RepID=UPI003D108DA4
MTFTKSPLSRLYLMRHANAAWAQPGTSDFDRELTDDGYAEAEIVADKAAGKNYVPARLLSSTAKRCRQTSEAIRRSMDEELDCNFIDTLYNAPADTLLEIIAAQTSSTSLMIVGHNPAMEEALVELVGEDVFHRAIPFGYPTAGLAVLDRTEPKAKAPYAWVLVDFLQE